MAGTLPAVAVGDSAERLTALFDVHYARLYRLARRLAPRSMMLSTWCRKRS